MAKDLKRRGWRFVGPTTVYAFMQAMGLVNDHMTGCAARAAGDPRAQGVPRSRLLDEADDRGDPDDHDHRAQRRRRQAAAPAGRRRSPPMIDPIAISSAGSHAMCAEKMKMIPATRLTSPASTTLSALTR